MKGPDHSFIFKSKNLKKFVNRIRQTEIVLGNYTKKAQKCEYSNMKSSKKKYYFQSRCKKKSDN